LACGYILASLHWYTWIAFSGWVSVSLIFYVVWGRQHSALNNGHDGPISTAEAQEGEMLNRPPKEMR
jgi:hypothetical protein